MKLVSFFVLSLAVHAGALVYPVSFHRQNNVELVQVTILPIEQESFGGNANGGTGNPAPRAGSKPVTRTPPSVQPPLQSRPPGNSEPKVTSVEAPTTVSNTEIAMAAATAKYDESYGAGTYGSTSMGAQNLGMGLGGTGIGSGASGTGSGNGNGHGSSENGVVTIQARIRESFRPDYPDNARRQNREGRVLLRVLVDDQGRSRQVEVHSSSGSDALDRSAVEAIKRWRFHPAHYGDQPVESWLRIPIEFRLTEVKSW
jgi:protein TonB